MKAICYEWQDNEQSGTHELAVFSNDIDINILKILDGLRQKYPLLKEQFAVLDYTPPLLNPKSIDQVDDIKYFNWQSQHSADILDYFPKQEINIKTGDQKTIGLDLDGITEVF